MATTSQRICDGQSAASLRPQWQPTHGQECHGCKTYDVHKSQWLTNLPSCISGRRRCLTYNNEPTSIANSLAQSGVAHAKAAHAASAFAASPKLKGGGLEASARDGRVVCSCKAFVTSVLSTITARGSPPPCENQKIPFLLKVLLIIFFLNPSSGWLPGAPWSKRGRGPRPRRRRRRRRRQRRRIF